MAEVAEPPAPAQTQDLGKTPTLLETLSQQMDVSGAPVITARSLPPITGGDDDDKVKEKKEEPKPEPKAEEKPEEKKTREEKESAEQEEWKKASEKVADKLFKKRGPPKKEEQGGDKENPGEPKVADDKPPVKPEEKKTTEKPTQRKRISEAEITERAAAAAAEAATRAVSKMGRQEAAPVATKAPDPKDSLSTAERKQFDAYNELEAIQPDRYKGVTAKYLKSLEAVQEYTKTWAKENPGQKFNPDAEEHNDFFARIEPEVDEDDWIDAKANLRARDIAAKAVAPLNDKLAEMERTRAKAALEPFVQQKQLESVHMLLENFDPEVAAEIRKPDGLKGLSEKDPITAGILSKTVDLLVPLAAEVIRLHDPGAGVEYDSRNGAHKEIADFILGQEQRIAALPAEDRMRDGKRFVGRLAYRNLPAEEKAGHWFLDQDDIINLFAQKYAVQAKKIRDEAVTKFNETAEKLGYKKIEAAKNGPADTKPKPKETPKPKESVTSPEAVSKTSVKTTAGGDTKPAPDAADVIVGRLFGALRS